MTDDGTPPEGDTTTAKIDRAELEALLREILPGFLADLGGDDGPDPDPGDDLDRPATVRDLEAWSEKTMTEAMKVLRAAQKPTRKPPTPKGDNGADAAGAGGSGEGSTGSGDGAGEPPPASPAFDLQGRLHKIFFGD
jgi:hypothetical protein